MKYAMARDMEGGTTRMVGPAYVVFCHDRSVLTNLLDNRLWSSWSRT